MVILGGHVGILDIALTPTQCESSTQRVYPMGAARHILRAARNHFRRNLPSASTCGRSVGIPEPQNPHRWPRGISCPISMDKRLERSVYPMCFQGFPHVRECVICKRGATGSLLWQGDSHPPCIWRTNPDWGDDLIDFALFGSKVLAYTPGTIRGEISNLRFWHLIVGFPAVPLGGGRYVQVL